MRLVLIGLVSLALALLGVRLLRLARRTGEQPERWLGLAFASAGASTWLLPLAVVDGMDPDAARGLGLAAQVGLSGAVVFLAAFAWRVFRPASSGARWLAVAVIGANAAACIALVATRMPVPLGALGLALIASRSAALLWLFLESAAYARRMQRKLRVGLADPVVANRFVLWAIWTGALALIPLFVLALRAAGVLEAPVPGAPLPAAVRASLAVLGTGGAVAFAAGWLAFFPTPSYQRWVERRAALAR